MCLFFFGKIVYYLCTYFYVKFDCAKLASGFRVLTNTRRSIGGLSMKGTLENKLGKVLIDSEVIAQYAGSTAVECFGIVGMAAVSMKDGLVKLLKGDSLTRGISVVIDENNLIEIDFHVIISYGVSIAAVADNLIENVKYKVSEFTGLEIKKINIYVEGVRVID